MPLCPAERHLTGSGEWQGLPQATVLSSTHTRTMLQTPEWLFLKLKILKLGQKESLFSHFKKKKVP